MHRTIVLDSNIWLGEQMLRHSTGSAVRFFLQKHGARVVVPEVVRLEVELHLERQLIELASQIREGHTRLLRAVGELKELVLPSDSVLRSVAKKAFSNTRIDISYFPFSLTSARSSLEKCICSEPPSGPKNQQFKDGVIWADCLQLATESPVHFVTDDKGFYESRDYKKGLASNLLVEMESLPNEITISHSIRSILDLFSHPIGLDYDQIHRQYYPEIRDKVEKMMGSEGFLLGDLLEGRHEVFATDDPDIAHVEFELHYRCNHLELAAGLLLVRGECVYRNSTKELEAFRGRSEEFNFVDSEGNKSNRKHFYAFGNSLILGHRNVRYDIRASLDR
jgi:hypothetical protein